ncbi:dynamin family protein [Salibacterium aidingense]|uniref:dynamin family protein n=1 Tax=Salibacterium aidingense TaxID=384933 RepID=UPI003BE37720
MMVQTTVKTESSLHGLPFYEEDERRLQAIETKRNHPAFEVAFCGHFSAGKSTLLNRLLGNELLPTSPIPTSANVISIQDGPVGLEVTNEQAETWKWEEEIPWDQVKNWGMNGEEIKQISIHAPLPFLSKYTRILDTPGVDSTDPSHQQITVDQLHTTDCIVYVSDYNHVQSETNLRFLKQMANEEKPIILVVNQIDKHDERELSLRTFENGLWTTLATAGIQPLRLFFTSMKNEQHSYNQFLELASYLKPILYHGSTLYSSSLPMLERGAVKQLKEKLLEEKQETYEKWREEAAAKGLSPDDAENHEKIVQALHDIEREKKNTRKALYEQRNKLLKDVTLFPYTTTEKARHWLESCHKNFKTGWLFTRQKTAEERKKRKDALLEELNEKIKTQLLFHIKNILSDMDWSYLKEPETYEQNVQQLSYTVQEELLDRYAPTSEFDRHFVYTFTDNVSSDIVKQIKSKTDWLFAYYVEAVEKQFQEKEDQLQEKLEQSADMKEEWQRWITAAEPLDQKIEACRKFLEERDGSSFFQEQLQETAFKEYPAEAAPPIAVTEQENSMIAAEEIYEEPVQVEKADDTFLEPLREYLNTYRERDLFQAEKEKLASLLKQYDQNRTIVSLFGAFSAGKSSFINAMLGDSILPVAPYPTTSAVNRIEKSNESFRHGTVLLEIKNEAFLEGEIRAASRELGTELDRKQLQNWKKPAQASLNEYQRTYSDYLFTLQQSLKKRMAEPGQQLECGLHELHEWVAEEEKACLVKEVTIYYDCRWTLDGLVLVDTPGVNSIHGRHTNVAFEQLRKSDAVLYVTYYNHAFSKADHVFLQQMARVNQHFHSNKLYFIINAADLAAANDELQGVKNHVREQLIQNGVDHPRLFTLSSKQGLEAKKNNTLAQDSFSEFESFFASSTSAELKAAHLEKIKEYWSHIYKLLKSLVSALDAGEHELEKRLQKRLNAAEAFRNQLPAFTMNSFVSGLQEELQQQCTYLQERTKFIIHDYFSQAVNPAVLTGSTKGKQKSQLLGALQELEGLAKTYLHQEQQTIMIRLEEKMKNHIYQYVQQFLEENKPKELTMEGWDGGCHFHRFVDMNNSFSLNKEDFLSFYQSSKDFFENKKSRQLKEAFAEAVQLETTAAASSFEEQVKEKIQIFLNETTSSIIKEFHEKIDNEKERGRWLFDTSRKKEVEEEFLFIEHSL